MPKEIRTVRWPDLFDGSINLREVEEPLFIDIGMFDISETIERAVRNLARNPYIAKVSVANNRPMLEAASRGQVNGRPIIVPRESAAAIWE